MIIELLFTYIIHAISLFTRSLKTNSTTIDSSSSRVILLDLTLNIKKEKKITQHDVFSLLKCATYLCFIITQQINK